MSDDREGMYESEADAQETEHFEYNFEDSSELLTMGEVDESPFSEVDEMELASSLLEVADEGEMDQFLGSLIKKAAGAIGGLVKSPIGRAVGGLLKGAARKALPWAGRALGTYIGGPAGGALGGKLASTVGGLFGLELEGMSQEDQEFEVARRFVRFAGAAARNAARGGSGVDPRTAARAAVAAAARRHAPGLLGGLAGAVQGAAGKRGRTGRWIRRGRNIIIVNC